MRAPPASPYSYPFISILHGFAEARSRMATIYRCPECGAEQRREFGAVDAPASVACWAVDGRMICTGRATQVLR